MKSYKNILVAIEFIPENDAILIAQAQKIASNFGGDKVYLAHAAEYLLDYEYMHDYGSHSIGVGFGVENAPEDAEENPDIECVKDDYGSHSIGLSSTRDKHLITPVKDTVLKNVRQEMIELGRRYGIPENRTLVAVDSAKFMILDEAERLGVDLIVIGSHGKHGTRSILGSTANAVIHGATCDIHLMRL